MSAGAVLGTPATYADLARHASFVEPNMHTPGIWWWLLPAGQWRHIPGERTCGHSGMPPRAQLHRLPHTEKHQEGCRACVGGPVTILILLKGS